MANYTTLLNSNNEELNEILSEINDLVYLPTLSSPAVAANIRSGKQAYDQNGTLITGTMATRTLARSTNFNASNGVFYSYANVAAGYIAATNNKATYNIAANNPLTHNAPIINVESNGLITATVTQGSAGWLSAPSTKTTERQLTTITHTNPTVSIDVVNKKIKASHTQSSAGYLISGGTTTAEGDLTTISGINPVVSPSGNKLTIYTNYTSNGWLTKGNYKTIYNISSLTGINPTISVSGNQVTAYTNYTSNGWLTKGNYASYINFASISSNKNPTVGNYTLIASANTLTTANIYIPKEVNYGAANIKKGVSMWGVSGTYAGTDWNSGTTPTVANVSGASYGFALNSNGYYESQNQGKNNSAALCKVTFVSDGTQELILNCINYAESGYDYGLLSNIDTTLSTSHTADTSNVYKSFEKNSSASVVTVNYGVVSAGTHYIYIKFRKDNSRHDNNDSLQFKVVSPTNIKNSIVSSIENKGVDVPSSVTLNQVSGYIDQISTGSAPSVDVSSSGLITATSGSFSTPYQLTSADDGDFVASNIKSGVTIFGTTGSYTSGSVNRYTMSNVSINGTSMIITFPLYYSQIICFECEIINTMYGTCSVMGFGNAISPITYNEYGLFYLENSNSGFTYSTVILNDYSIQLNFGYNVQGSYSGGYCWSAADNTIIF